MTIKIGDTLWCDKEHGRSRWRSAVITGETKQSWLVGDPNFTRSKINKKTLIEANGRGRGMGDLKWYTPEQMADEKFVRSNRYRIERAVGAVRDRATLEAVAALIGFSILPMESESENQAIPEAERQKISLQDALNVSLKTQWRKS